MSSYNEQPSAGETLIERELTEEVLRAHKAINKYTNARQRLAGRNKNPEQNPKLQGLLNDVDVATLSAFDSLKPYARRELAARWMDTVVGQWRGRPVVFGSRLDDAAHDEEWYLDDLRGRVESHTYEKPVRFEGVQEVTEHYAVLLDITAYMKVEDLLFQTLREADFAPQPDMPTYEGEEVLTHDE
jgi:hypothetical protein